jgi:hypothetical protein
MRSIDPLVCVHNRGLTPTASGLRARDDACVHVWHQTAFAYTRPHNGALRQKYRLMAVDSGSGAACTGLDTRVT